jgi:hypothetical protein
MTQHLKFGGSSAARTVGCAAWLSLSDDMPKRDGSNPAADTGTMLHNCMEELYTNETQTPEKQLAARRSHKGQELTQELIVSKLVPAIGAIEDLMGEHTVNDFKLEPFVKIDDDIGGSIDFIGLSDDKKTVVVADYKFGYVPVDVEDNKQLHFYALAAATDPLTRDWFDAAEQIVLAIIQPNENGDVLRTQTISMTDLDSFETEYLDAVDRSEEPDAVPTSGDWCKYCPAHSTCPVKTGLALKATRVNEITADKLAEYLPMADEVVAWAKNVQKMAHEQLELGTPIKGYKLVHKRASRVWNDAPAVENKIRKARKIKLEQGFDMKLKSPAQLEKLAKEIGVNFKEYDQYISAVSSGTTLAKESDKRAAVLPVQGLEQLNAMTT